MIGLGGADPSKFPSCVRIMVFSLGSIQHFKLMIYTSFNKLKFEIIYLQVPVMGSIFSLQMNKPIGHKNLNQSSSAYSENENFKEKKNAKSIAEVKESMSFVK